MLLFVAALALLASCNKKEATDNTVDKWNGYEEYYKTGEMYKDIVTRKGAVVGTATYGIDDNANFYVTLETSGAWEFSKTFMYAGKWKNMPKRRKRKPKTRDFPFNEKHDPFVTSVTYTIPLVDLPPAEEPGFVVAAGGRAYNPNKCWDDDDYTLKKVWATWDRRFSCKTWGGYSNYYYNQPYEPHTILYGTEYRNDSLAIYLIDATDGTSTLISTDYVGTPPDTTFDGTAWDPTTGQFFFTNYGVQELWVDNMDSTDAYKVGDLGGIAASATYDNGSFYYVDQTNNQVMEVVLTGTDTLSIASETLVSTVPTSIAVNDIAYDPVGGTIYFVGVYQTNVELISLDVTTDTYSTITLAETIQPDAQIAYGDDGSLYMVSGSVNGGGSIVSALDPQTGVATPIDDNVIVPVPLSDLAGGPLK